MTLSVPRRQFLAHSAIAGLVLGFVWTPRQGWGAELRGADAPPKPNAFLRIAPDNAVTIISKHLEMGQGVYTGLATILAEELDADWATIKVEAAPANAALYNNLTWGPMQGTGNSSSIFNSYTQLRKAGAAARQMLITVAAAQWNVPTGEITVENGVLRHQARRATFGEFAALAAALPVPTDPPLKARGEFRLIGGHLPRIDTPDKVVGKALYTIDVKLPEMVTAVVAHPPRFGGKVKSFDNTSAAAVKGVHAIFAIPTGVAVVASDFWSASKARDALQIEWDDSAAEMRGSDAILAAYQDAARVPGVPARNDGDAAGVKAAKMLEASFTFPFLCHAAMEPLNCVVHLTAENCELWTSCQTQTLDQKNAAAAAELKPEQVKINTLLAGGSFGRRSYPLSDHIVEAVHVAKGYGKSVPVKLQWTREDDMRSGAYRPFYLHTIKAGLDDAGKLVSWQHRIVGQSITTGTAFAFLIKNGVDPTSVYGAIDLPYAIPNLSVDLHTTTLGIPITWWRSVASSHTAHSTEIMIDEAAHAAGQDPVDYRLAMLEASPRHARVLQLVAEKADWGSPLPKGRGRGIAVHAAFHTYVAHVAEVTVADDGTIKVDRIVCAVDCGVAVNPDIIRAQFEGGAGYALSALLYGEITVKDGLVEQSNFDAYRVLRMEEMPEVEVHIVASDEAPTGVGEPAVPTVGPAVLNAVFAATGRRIYTLPLARPLAS